MTALDAVVVLLAAIVFAQAWRLIELRGRVNRLEVHVAMLRDYLEDATQWVSPNHRLPPHIKHLDIQR